MERLIYFGGSFPFQYKDYAKENLAKDYRAIVLGNVDSIVKTPANGLQKIKEGVFYVGPFYFYEEGMSASDIVKKEHSMVEKCTDAIFLLDNSMCPGTITEIIHASLAKKNVYIFYEAAKIDDGEPENEINSKQWYAITFSKLVNESTLIIRECKDRNEAIEKIVELVHNIF